MRCYRVGQVKFIVKRGDITEEEVDAIVVPANSRLIMGGGVAGAVKVRGGESIEREAMSKAPIRIGEAVATGAGKLSAKYVIHAPTMERPAGETSAEKVYMATKAAAELASRLGIGEVAFPGMGTGVGGLEPNAAAREMIRAIIDAAESGKGVDVVRLVAFNKELEDAFIKALEEASR
ncbi:MAG: macro domain-containing protein [Nitrososphaerota archaeon]